MTSIPGRLLPAIELTLPASLQPADAAAQAEVEREVLGLFDAWAAGLRRYIGSFGVSPEVADDILQDVFLSLFRHLQRGRPRTNLKAWLFQVAHNLSLKQRQRHRRRQNTETCWDVALADRLIDPDANPEQQLADGQRRQRLARVVWAMPERDRQCLYLRAEGLAYREIARTLGVSLGSVAKSLSRAMTRLADADRR